MSKELTIVVTNYKTPDILKKSLELLNKYASESKIIMVDSDSQDNSVEICQKHFPAVEIIEVKNHSMGNAANTGIFAAKTKYIMQMNADVFIAKNTIKDMINILKKPNIAMVAPRAKDKNGHWQNQGLLYKRYHYYLDFTKNPSIAADWLHGCCLMFKRDVLEHGGFDTNFRFYNEDIEWSYRLRKAGLECHLVNTELVHLGGSSTPDNINFIIEAYRGGFILSEMYKPKWYQELHWFYVLSESHFQTSFSKNNKKQAFWVIRKMFLKRDFKHSPFGQDLNTSNKQFAHFK